MLRRLVLILVLLPFVEMGLLLLLADKAGWQIALLFVIATGVAGAWLLQRQGLRTWRRIREELAAGRAPGEAIGDAAMLLLAGALLLSPGVLTDLLGVTLLLPPCRRWYRRLLLRWFQGRTSLLFRTPHSSPPPGNRTVVIDSYVVKRHPDARD